MKNGLQSKTLALFFSKGTSLKLWENLGMLPRELSLYKELAHYFHKIYFFTYGDFSEKEYQKYLPENIVICPKTNKLPLKLYSIFLPFFYIKEIRETNILKTNQMSGSWAAVIAKWMSGAKLVVRLGYEWLEVMERRKYSFFTLKLAAFLENMAYRSANKIIFSNEADKEFARSRFLLNSEKILVIPNFVNTELFKPFPVPKEKNRVIFIGKLEEQKNVFELIEAVATLDVRLIIIGNGSERKALEDFANKKSAKVEFLGNIPNEKLPEELNKSDIFILPSLYEGHPKALLEAMSVGLPCIGTNVKGINTVIKHKVNGYLCDTGAINIRAAIQEVLNDKELSQSMGHHARETIINSVSLKKILDMELDIYNNLV